MNIIPAVNGTYNLSAGEFVLPHKIRFNKTCAAVQVFFERLNRIGEYALSVGDGADIELRLSPAEYEYKLEITGNKIVLSYSREEGLNLGLTTLFQLVAFGKGKIQCAVICDSPEYKVRSLMLDVCRHFFGVEEVKKVIEQCALLKFNRLHLCLSQDQGYRLESKRFPLLNEISSYRRLSPQDPLVTAGKAKPGERYGGFYTAEEVKELVAYAAARGMEIVPELNVPGHMSAILAAYPQFTCSGKPLLVKGTFGVHERIMCAGNGEAYEFLCALLDEICDMFPSSYISLGGDEAPKSEWKNCPKCREELKKRGLENFSALQTDIINGLIRYLKERGKTAIVWNESAIGGNLDKSAVVQYWLVNDDDGYIKEEIKRGRKFLLSDMNRLYFDYSYAEIPMRSTLKYEPEIGGVKIPKEQTEGIEATMFTEWTPQNEDIERMLYPRLLAAAECCATDSKNADEFMERAKRFLDTDGLNILTPMPWDKATICGDEALDEIVKNMTSLGAKIRGMKEFGEEEGGKAVLVEHDGKKTNAPPVSPRDMIYALLFQKMSAAYTKEEIERTVNKILDLKRK